MKLIPICLCDVKQYLLFNNSVISTQHSFSECITIKFPKSLLAQFYSTHRGSKAQKKNHYDTLGITPHATQSEIKSAYYKLTLQYHPDRNKNEHAKQKFQDISDAYRILGNHEQRKNYDRQTMIHQKPMYKPTADKTPPQPKNMYTATGSRIYNFDEWVHAHYGRQFEETLKRRTAYRRMKEIEDSYKQEKKQEETRSLANIIIYFFILVVVIYLFCMSNSKDVPASKIKKDKKDDINTN